MTWPRKDRIEFLSIKTPILTFFCVKLLQPSFYGKKKKVQPHRIWSTTPRFLRFRSINGLSQVFRSSDYPKTIIPVLALLKPGKSVKQCSRGRISLIEVADWLEHPMQSKSKQFYASTWQIQWRGWKGWNLKGILEVLFILKMTQQNTLALFVS